MAKGKLVFDAPGSRGYRQGVDQLVLYVKKADGTGYEDGVAWNGITSVTLSPEGGDETPVYADNIKYLSLRSPEELKATIEALESPKEFDVCDGAAEVDDTIAGVTVHQQTRRAFAFAYITKKCTDTNPDGKEVITVVYGCTASPSEVASETINDSPDAAPLSWEVSATKVDVTGFKPVAHITIDSSVLPKAKFDAIKDLLYGTNGEQGAEGTAPTLAMPDTIIGIVKAQ